VLNDAGDVAYQQAIAPFAQVVLDRPAAAQIDNRH